MLRFRLGLLSFEFPWWVLTCLAVFIGLGFWHSEFTVVPVVYSSLIFHELIHALVAWFSMKSPSKLVFSSYFRGHTSSSLSRPFTEKELFWFYLAPASSTLVFGGLVLILGMHSWAWLVGGGFILGYSVYNLSPVKNSDLSRLLEQPPAKKW